MTPHEQKARELALKCAGKCYGQTEEDVATILRELALAKLVEDSAMLDKLEGLCQQWRAMAQALGEELKRRHGWHVLEQGANNEHCGACDLISRFNKLNQ